MAEEPTAIPEWLAAAEGTDRSLTLRSRILKTDQGSVEFAVSGSGPTLLVVHGRPGGYDQAMLLGAIYQRAGFQVVGFSRPGYLQTPLESGQSVAEQAELAEKLLDGLGLSAVGIVATSAGAPLAYQLALAHPERVRTLLVIDGVCKQYPAPTTSFEQHIFMSGPGQAALNWMYRHHPERLVRNLLSKESTMSREAAEELSERVIADPYKFEFVRGMLKTISPVKAREAGFENDLQLKDLAPMPLAGIQCPALIVQARDDDDVTPDQAEYAAANIPNAELYWIESGSHLAYWIGDDAEKSQAHSIDFLRAHVS